MPKTGNRLGNRQSNRDDYTSLPRDAIKRLIIEFKIIIILKLNSDCFLCHRYGITEHREPPHGQQVVINELKMNEWLYNGLSKNIRTNLEAILFANTLSQKIVIYKKNIANFMLYKRLY